LLLRPRKHLVRFGVFEFDPASGDLWKKGRRIKLQNQPRQVLGALIARAGELVTRDELRRRLWPDDTFVDFDNGLNVAVRKIRDALDDVAPASRYIETERAQGYRFIAPVAVEPGAPDRETSATDHLDRQSNAADPQTPAPLAAKDHGRAGRIAPANHRAPLRQFSGPVFAALAVVVLAGAGVWLWPGDTPGTARARLRESSVPALLAVLPFSNRAGDREGFLATSIPEAIVTRLSGLRHVRVRPAGIVSPSDGQAIDAHDAGRRLGVEYVLAGTIHTAADRVRISVRLVATADGSPIWGDQYDYARQDVPGIEDRIAEAVAKTLRLQLSEAERERFYRRYTVSGSAYERYLMGRALLRSTTEAGAKAAIVEFEAALALDPAYALASAGIATAAAQLRVRFASREEYGIWDARAREAAGRALQLDPDLAEAHVAIAAVHRFQEYDWDTVIRESRRALDLNASLDTAHLYLAAAYFHLGLLDEAQSEVRAARELNPENRIEPFEILGAISLFAGRTDEAAAYLSQVHDLTDSRIVTYLLGWTLYYQGDRERAEMLLESLAGGTGPLPGNARATLAAIRAARGATAEARALAEQAASEPELIHHAAYGLGTAYAQLGEPATAVRWLARAAATGFSCYPWYERDPLLDPIRTDERFAGFMRDLHGSWADACARYSGRLR
jgi:TolB-like protein/DNA-binding winged helix-turn-helix (wHTH) protein/Tfp pilus assembly protein PilF